MGEQPAPVREGERLAHLDVLRGLAVLGILAVNTPSAFALPPDAFTLPNIAPVPFDDAALRLWLLVRIAFEGKFIALFSMLFGVSVYLVGGELTDWARGRVLLRRLGWLVLFGVVHGALIWFGDILLLYAIVGFAAFLCRSWPPVWLAGVGVVLFAYGAFHFLAPGLALQAAPLEVQVAAFQRFQPAAILQTVDAFRGDLAQVAAANFEAWARVAPDAIQYHASDTLGLMLIGLALFKARVLQGGRSARLYASMAAVGAAAMAVVAWQAMGEARRGFSPPEVFGRASVANTLLAPVVTLGYVGLLNLALRSGLFRRAALVLAPVGRMAFTNYIAQSLIMTTLFYGGRGFGLFGRLGWPEMAGVVLAVWALQLIWSPLWLSRFTTGPLEWIWRRLSYGRSVPLRRPVERPAAPAA
ncbi:MAG: DUF418 domain-containing protein [Proteobacteria bacterium]|nr:DUF418 domain-containing protein [Pseudomonadota bacterium]